MRAIAASILVLCLCLPLFSCNVSGSGGIFCYEHKTLEGRWRREVDADRASAIRFDGQGYIVEADPNFQYLVGKRAQVDCGGEIHGDVKGEFINTRRMRLEGYLWNKI